MQPWARLALQAALAARAAKARTRPRGADRAAKASAPRAARPGRLG